jgi:hypothetical protein
MPELEGQHLSLEDRLKALIGKRPKLQFVFREYDAFGVFLKVVLATLLVWLITLLSSSSFRDLCKQVFLKRDNLSFLVIGGVFCFSMLMSYLCGRWFRKEQVKLLQKANSKFQSDHERWSESVNLILSELLSLPHDSKERHGVLELVVQHKLHEADWLHVTLLDHIPSDATTQFKNLVDNYMGAMSASLATHVKLAREW